MKKVLSFLLLRRCSSRCCRLCPGAGGVAGRLLLRRIRRRYGTITPTDRVNMTLNGAALNPVDVPALVQYPETGNGRTLVPVRLIAEALGADVTWVPETRQAILMQGERLMVLTLGSATALVDGQEVPLPDGIPRRRGEVGGEGEPPWCPCAFVSEQLGAEVDWDGATFTAVITSQSQPEPTPTPEPSPSPSPEPSPEPTPAPEPIYEDRGTVSDVSFDGESQTVTITADHHPEYRVIDLGDRVCHRHPGGGMSPGAGGQRSPWRRTGPC